MICKICGSQIPDDAKKCEVCGADIETELNQNEFEDTQMTDDFDLDKEREFVAEEIFDENEKKRREQMEKMMEDKKQQLSEIERRRNQKRKKQRRNKIVLITIICALAVSAVGIGTYSILRNMDSGDETTVKATPVAAATPVPTPVEIVTPAPSPEMLMPTAIPQTSPAPSGQSWTATGNGTSSGNTTTSGNKSTSTSSSGSSSTSKKGTSSSSNANTGSSSGNKATSSSSASKPSTGSSSTGSNASSANSNVTNSGISTSNISSKLAKGGEVIYNTGTGKYLMTFTVDSTRYYANVSAGSTTAQIKNKYYTITAAPTQETYNGNTVYEINDMTRYDSSDYVIKDSGTRLLTNDDIKGLSKYSLALARNEIYARHGRKFQTPEYNDYFSGKSWYHINPNYNYSDDNSNLNSIEIANVKLILAAERK